MRGGGGGEGGHSGVSLVSHLFLVEILYFFSDELST